MYQKAQSIYYSLALFLIGAGIFILYPSNQSEMIAWQNQTKTQISIAWEQTMGDQPWFVEFGDFYENVTSFYTQAADSTIALIAQPESDADLAYIYGSVYHQFAAVFQPKTNNVTGIAYDRVELPTVPNFMQEDSLFNIVPYQTVVKTILDTGSVAGASVQSDLPVNSENSWVTIKDNMTGQLYCLAVYDGTVNKYLGPCKRDHYQ